MYLSHLDSDTYDTMKTTLLTNDKAPPLPLLIKYFEPGIATTITHMMSKTPANNAYVNISQEICGSCSEENNNAVVLTASYQGQQEYGNHTRNRCTPKSLGPRRQPTRATIPFKETCYDCVWEGYHVTEY